MKQEKHLSRFEYQKKDVQLTDDTCAFAAAGGERVLDLRAIATAQSAARATFGIVRQCVDALKSAVTVRASFGPVWATSGC